MRTATDLLAGYAEYHRDPRNISSHFVGVPMIVFASGVLLARPAFAVGGLMLSPAWVLFAAVVAWFLTRGDIVLGCTVSLATGVLIFLAHRTAYSGGFFLWLGSGVGLFLLGWTIQALGHWYEGRKPAFIDDMVGLLIGPMFIVAELLFMTGWNKPLMEEIERRAGPTRLRDIARIA